MAEIGIVVGALLLLLLWGTARRIRTASASNKTELRAEEISLEAMTQRVSELAPTLRHTAMVTAYQGQSEQGYVWASPCGKRVYLN